jgi:hypothetical protein
MSESQKHVTYDYGRCLLYRLLAGLREAYLEYRYVPYGTATQVLP